MGSEYNYHLDHSTNTFSLSFGSEKKVSYEGALDEVIQNRTIHYLKVEDFSTNGCELLKYAKLIKELHDQLLLLKGVTIEVKARMDGHKVFCITEEFLGIRTSIDFKFSEIKLEKDKEDLFKKNVVEYLSKNKVVKTISYTKIHTKESFFQDNKSHNLKSHNLRPLLSNIQRSFSDIIWPNSSKSLKDPITKKSQSDYSLQNEGVERQRRGAVVAILSLSEIFDLKNEKIIQPISILNVNEILDGKVE